RVREHALRLAEPFASAPDIHAQFAKMTDDFDLRVRYQLAFSLGTAPSEMSSRALAKLARRDGGDSWFRLAILTPVHRRAGAVFRLLMEDESFRVAGHGRELLAALATLIGSANRKDEIADFVQGLNALPERESALGQNLVRNLAAKLPASGRGQLGGGKAGAVLAELLRDARKAAPDEKRP